MGWGRRLRRMGRRRWAGCGDYHEDDELTAVVQVLAMNLEDDQEWVCGELSICV